jgi:hypothetical protein
MLRLGAPCALVFLLTAATAVAGGTDDHKALMIAGQVMRNSGNLLRARETLKACATDVCAAGDPDCEAIRTYCKTKLGEVEPEIPSFVMHVVDDRGLPISDATVLVDTVPVDATKPVEVDPGPHLVRTTYAGRAGTLQIEADRSKRNIPARIVIDLRQDTFLRPVPWYTIAFGTLAGVAALTAVGFGVAAQVEANSLTFCFPNCDPTGAGGHPSQGVFTATTVTVDVALGVAVVGALVATFGYLLRPSIKRVVHIEQGIVHGGP